MDNRDYMLCTMAATIASGTAEGDWTFEGAVNDAEGILAEVEKRASSRRPVKPPPTPKASDGRPIRLDEVKDKP